MTADEQAFVDRVDRVLLDLETGTPAVQRLRQVPTDLIAVAVMRQLAHDGAALPFPDAAIAQALFAILRRNIGAPSTRVVA